MLYKNLNFWQANSLGRYKNTGHRVQALCLVYLQNLFFFLLLLYLICSKLSQRLQSVKLSLVSNDVILGSIGHSLNLLLMHLLLVSNRYLFPGSMATSVSYSTFLSPKTTMASYSVIGRKPLLLVMKHLPQRFEANTSAPSTSPSTACGGATKNINTYSLPIRSSSLTNVTGASGVIANINNEYAR